MGFFSNPSQGMGTLAQLMQQAPNFPAHLPDNVREAIMSSPTFNEHYAPFPWSPAVQDLWKKENAAVPPGRPDFSAEEFLRILRSVMERDQGSS